MHLLGVKWVISVEVTFMLCLTSNIFGSAVTSQTDTPYRILLIPSDEYTGSCFSSEVLNGTHDVEVCVKGDNNSDCCQRFDCGVEIEHIKNAREYNVYLPENALSQQDVVLITSPLQHYCCMPSRIYNTTGLLLSISECLDTGNKNPRLSQKGLCGANSSFDEECEELDREGSLFRLNLNNGKICKRCQLPGTKPNVTISESYNSSNIDAQEAVQLMDRLPDLLAKIGPNNLVAAVVFGDIKGVLSILKEENENINLGITSKGDMNILADSETGFKKMVKIPKEASDMAVKKNSTYVGVLLFPGMHHENPDRRFLNDEVVGIEMGAKISNLSDRIVVRYRLPENGTNFSCVSWDGKDNGERDMWVTDGCQTELRNDSIVCSCSHLTFFAVMMVAAPANMSASDFKSLNLITSIGCGISIFFLAAACFMHFVIRREKKSLSAQILMQLFMAMLALNLAFLVNESVANMGGLAACVSIATALHYALLATFSWFFIQALHLNMSLWKQPSKIKHYVTKIYILGWITPAGVVIPFLVLKQYDYLIISTDDGNLIKMCWIPNAVLQQGVNLGYYAVVFFFTFSTFIITLRQIVLFKAGAGGAQQQGSVKANAYSVLSLFLLLGLTWAFAFFSHGPLRIPFYYIFTILNSFQGFFLFIYYYNTSRNIVDGAVSGTSTSGTTVITSPYK